MKAFVFSLDSFVAFTLTVAALYTLVFFSTVPSAYYASLMQANYLAKDTLLALATTSYDADETYLSKIVGDLREGDAFSARLYIGALVPHQYGYKLQVWDGDAGEWNTLYDTADDQPESLNNGEYHKLKATSQSVFLILDPGDPGESPYSYITCSGSYTVCDEPPYDEKMILGDASLELIRLMVYA